MKITIQTRGFKATKKLLSFITKKLNKLDELNNTIVEGHVVFRLDKSDVQENKICEIKLAVPGNDLFASRQTQSFEESASKVIRALKRQLLALKVNHKGARKARPKKLTVLK